MQASLSGRQQVVCRSSAISSRRGCRAQWVTVQHGGGRSVNSPNPEGCSGFTTAMAVELCAVLPGRPGSKLWAGNPGRPNLPSA